MSINARVKEIILENIEMDDDEIGDDELFTEHGVDSLTALDILTDLEREYRIKMGEKVLRDFTTINNIIAAVQRSLEAGKVEA